MHNCKACALIANKKWRVKHHVYVVKKLMVYKREHRELYRDAQRKYIAEIKADPVRYAAWLKRQRHTQAERRKYLPGRYYHKKRIREAAKKRSEKALRRTLRSMEKTGIKRRRRPAQAHT